jgi:O-acetyl-ADP-ribose deacetylase (regulator of RNase III)
MNLIERTADLLDLAEKGEVDVIVHQANLQHTFGAGIAAAIRRRFPYAFEADRRTEQGSTTKLGHFSVGTAGPAKPAVVNLYSQTSLYPSHTSYDHLYDGLVKLRNMLEPLSTVRTIGFPYQMGCGLADGNWSVVKAIILAVFDDSRFNIVIAKLPETKASDPVVDMMVEVGVDAFKTINK